MASSDRSKTERVEPTYCCVCSRPHLCGSPLEDGWKWSTHAKGWLCWRCTEWDVQTEPNPDPA